MLSLMEFIFDEMLLPDNSVVYVLLSQSAVREVEECGLYSGSLVLS